VSSRQVKLWDANGAFVTSEVTNYSGEYEFTPIDHGTYFVTTSLSSSLDQLFDGVPCPGGAPDGCDPTTGDPIVVSNGAVVDGIDFRLDPPSAATGVAGVVTASSDGRPLSSVYVGVYDLAGNRVRTDITGPDGLYLVDGIEAGTYLVGTYWGSASTYRHEMFDDIPCGLGLPGGCDPLAGTRVNVVSGAITRHIDFDLSTLASIHVQVLDVGTGMPVSGARCELYSPAGIKLASVSTSVNGNAYFDRLDAGSYYLWTNGGSDHHEQLYDGVS
jgi:hypothetical protein